MTGGEELLIKLQQYQDATSGIIEGKDKKIIELELALAKLIELLERRGITKDCPKGDPMVGVC